MVSRKRVEFIARLKEDLKKFKSGEIDYIPSGKDYAKMFMFNRGSLSRWLKTDLTEEEFATNLEAVNKRRKNYWDILPEEDKQKRKEKTKNSGLKGVLGEKVFEKQYQGYGWVTIKLTERKILDNGNVISIVDFEKLEEILENVFTFQNKTEFIQKIISDLREIKEKGFYLPDYILVKASNIPIFYEIKNSGKKGISMHKKQRLGIAELRKKGYKVYPHKKNISLENLDETNKEILGQILLNRDKHRKERENIQPLPIKSTELKRVEEDASQEKEHLEEVSYKKNFKEIYDRLANISSIILLLLVLCGIILPFFIFSDLMVKIIVAIIIPVLIILFSRATLDRMLTAIAKKRLEIR